MGADRVADALAVVAGGMLAWRWRHEARAWTWIDRAGAAALAPVLVVSARVAVRIVVGAVGIEWNGARLAPTVAFARGYRLYYPASEGPVLDTIYGPVAALAYLPVALFRSPTPAILTGAALNLAFVTVPLLAFGLRAAGRDAGAELRVVTAWLGICLLMTSLPGPYYWLSMTHADGPTLALGLLACTVILPRAGETAPSTMRLALVATLATLSAWAKQTSLLLGLSLLPFVGWVYGRGSAMRYVISLVVVGLVCVALFTTIFGFEPMWFNLVTVPHHQPWYFPGAAGLLHVGSWMLRAARPAIALAIVAAGARVAERSGISAAVLVPLLPAIVLVPTGALAANKFGGNENSFHAVYFLLAATLAMLVAGNPGRSTRRFACACAYAVGVVGVVVAWRYGYCKLRAPAPVLFPNPHQQAYDFARAHPGAAYFPAYPLSTLLAEGRLYHLAYGVFDRTLGGSAPTAEHFRANLPPRLEYVVVRGRDRKAMEYLPEYTDARTSEELPGWTLLVRAEPAAEAMGGTPVPQRARTSASDRSAAAAETSVPARKLLGR